MSEPVTRDVPAHSSSREPEAPAAVGLAELIREAEALHATLSDSRSRVAKLIAGLRRHRRRGRLMESTLATLRQLKLQDVGT